MKQPFYLRLKPYIPSVIKGIAGGAIAAITITFLFYLIGLIVLYYGTPLV